MEDEEENPVVEEESIPVLDKLDYRRLLYKMLEQAYVSEGTVYFSRNVKRLVIACKTRFPNMDFYGPIQSEQNRLYDVYTDKIDKLKEDYEIWGHPLKRAIHLSTYEEQYWQSVLEFIRDLLARNRGLLFGRSDTQGISYSELEK